MGVTGAKPRQWTDTEKVEALLQLDLNGGNVYRTAKEFEGLPYDTLLAWSKGKGLNDDIRRAHACKQIDLHDTLEDLARLIVGMLPEKLETATGKDAGIVLGIVVDKMQILRGQPSSVTATKQLPRTPAETVQALRQLLDEAPESAGDRAAAAPAVPAERELVPV